VVVRLLSAFTALPIVLWLMWTGGWAFGLLVLGVGALGLQEFHQMTQPDDRLGRWFYTAAGVALLYLELTGLITGATFMLLFAAVPILASAFVLFRTGNLETAAARVGLGCLGLLWTTGLLGATAGLRLLDHGFAWLLMACAFAWGSDSGAYFVGRALGRHKLYSKVSPSKTLEGAIGGVVVGTGISFGVWALFGPDIDPVHLAVIAPLGAAMGQVGDLAESLVKRSVGVKDSGNFLPGHGGVLDRIDALLFAGPTLFGYALWAGEAPRWLPSGWGG
jgi:phosphatidate cytidylyltransferase